MIYEILLALLQSATEYLPISSSGHMALFSNYLSKSDLFLFTALHLASLIAILIYFRKDILNLLHFDKDSKNYILLLIIGIIPAGVFGLFFNNTIENVFSSNLFIGFALIFTSIMLLLTKFVKLNYTLNFKTAIIIGLFQMIALFPGVSRSGMTISSALILGIREEEALKFSFLMFIPLSIGAFLLEFIKLDSFTITYSLVFSFILTIILSLGFLVILRKIINNNIFWMFSIYCFILGIITIVINI